MEWESSLIARLCIALARNGDKKACGPRGATGGAESGGKAYWITPQPRRAPELPVGWVV
ncbi:hypothetical protein GCM10027276_21370 [Comamonas piscis]